MAEAEIVRLWIRGETTKLNAVAFAGADPKVALPFYQTAEMPMADYLSQMKRKVEMAQLSGEAADAHGRKPAVIRDEENMCKLATDHMIKNVRTQIRTFCGNEHTKATAAGTVTALR